MRDAIIIAIACIIAIVIGGWLFFLNSDEFAVGVPSAASVSFAVISEGQHAGNLTERKNYRIKSEAELQELWRMMYATNGPPAPVVDFGQHEVLAIFDGTHASGGYDVDVVSVIDDGSSRRITLNRIVPGESCMVTQAITSPYKIIALAKSSALLAREERTEVRECR